MARKSPRNGLYSRYGISLKIETLEKGAKKVLEQC